MTPPRPPHCFVSGTMLVTLKGEVPVETVLPGDLALTLSGNGAPLKPVIWTGQLTVDLANHPDPITVRPIRIAENAVEPGMPIRDLLVSPDHGISLEDDRGRRVLVPAHFLVNGATIRREPAQGRVTYVHVEVDGHDILMANGMAAESYFDAGNRGVFDNTVVPFARGGPVPPAALPDFSPAARENGGAAPLLVGAATHALHARLRAVAEETGYRLTEDPALTATCGATEAELISDADGDYVFLLPPGAGAVTLRSRLFTPAETDPAGGDQRLLGVAVARIVHDGVDIGLNSAACRSGFLPIEQGVDERWRWTVGDAILDLPPADGEATLEVTIRHGWGRYWLAPEPRS